jgi:leucyl aminopeptidase
MNAKEKSPYIYSFDNILVDKSDKPIINIRLIKPSDFDDIYTRSSASVSRQMEQSGFKAKEKQFCVIRNDTSMVMDILIGASFPLGLYALSSVFEKIKLEFSFDFLSSIVFKIENNLSDEESTQSAIGWALAGYRFDLYKKDKYKKSEPVLIWPKNADKARCIATVEGLCLIKTLINMPANILGTDELADAAGHIAKLGKAQFNRIVDKDLIDKNFPMIYEVGKASPRRPQLVEFVWGEETHRALTLVGKGVVFDTGGLDIKPPAFMGLMKKDMGGAAQF